MEKRNASATNITTMNEHEAMEEGAEAKEGETSWWKMLII